MESPWMIDWREDEIFPVLYNNASIGILHHAWPAQANHIVLYAFSKQALIRSRFLPSKSNFIGITFSRYKVIPHNSGNREFSLLTVDRLAGLMMLKDQGFSPNDDRALIDAIVKATAKEYAQWK